MSGKRTGTLRDVPRGSSVQVRSIGRGEPFSLRLRELGFCENTVVRCITNLNGSIVCQIADSRLGLNHHAAESIVVSEIE